MAALSDLRDTLRRQHHADGDDVLASMLERFPLPPELRARASNRATGFVEAIRSGNDIGLMEVFLAEYGLSTEEGVALMCLAEALLRVPDADTIDALIEDRIAPSSWSDHIDQSTSPLVNASTWALLLTGKVLDPEPGDGLAGVLRGALKRVGEPVIRAAVMRALKELGRQFVLGETIESAMQRATGMEARGYTYSYDMLGEAAMTAAQADTFERAYTRAIAAAARATNADDVRANPGVSVKLSALHPRYEEAQRERVLRELVPRLTALALTASRAHIGLNIDAEEAARLELSLDVIEATLRDERLAGWHGFGVVVQGYGKRASVTIEWLDALAAALDRRLMVRLVKGAYWDTEVKLAQVEGLDGFPVFTRKAATDVAYLACARQLLDAAPRLYPQFATHNANSIATILEMAGEQAFEFQRLHGMGEALHEHVRQQHGSRCRIYAPVGAHRDLLAYLVRRLLENGANSSFVNQVVDVEVPASEVAADPMPQLEHARHALVLPNALFAPSRVNSAGFDLSCRATLARIDAARSPYRDAVLDASPLLAGNLGETAASAQPLTSPFATGEVVTHVTEASAAQVQAALDAARPWDAPVETRAETLRAAADAFEANFGELFAALAREAGKTLPDAVAELREAVDFLRYYAAEAERQPDRRARGLVACISPWNFPLAIFTGQLSAALAAGNGVLAKPAEATPGIAACAVRLLHAAGVPRSALQLLPGRGAVVGAALTSDRRIDAVCFTGSTATAQRINRTMADHLAPGAALVAETGGINAMIVDSTALPEQAVRDIVMSSFRSAGQRCSALRILYLQEDIASSFLDMLEGAIAELRLGDPWRLDTDVGPVISADAKRDIESYVAGAAAAGRLRAQLDTPRGGHFVAPAVIEVDGIEDLPREVFGPVLHVATFAFEALDDVIDAINASGYGLTFGLHTRIDSRVEHVVRRIRAGNAYVNRNQIGAVVGSQPFGGEGLSGTGPKAGGPHYVARFFAVEEPATAVQTSTTRTIDADELARAIAALPPMDPAPMSTAQMPGPTGESNTLTAHARGAVLCLGPRPEDVSAQAAIASACGCAALGVAPGASGNGKPRMLDGFLPREALRTVDGFDAVALWSDEADARAARCALAERDGALIPLLTERDFGSRLALERHLCVDTTAAGGNASLLAAQDNA